MKACVYLFAPIASHCRMYHVTWYAKASRACLEMHSTQIVSSSCIRVLVALSIIEILRKLTQCTDVVHLVDHADASERRRQNVLPAHYDTTNATAERHPVFIQNTNTFPSFSSISTHHCPLDSPSTMQKSEMHDGVPLRPRRSAQGAKTSDIDQH